MAIFSWPIWNKYCALNGDVVVTDNLSAHKVRGVSELITACGAELLYLPPTRPISIPLNNAGRRSNSSCVPSKLVPQRPWNRLLPKPSPPSP